MTNPNPPEEFNPEPPMTNVHECLNSASFSSANAQAMENFSVRLPKALKAQAMAICRTNTTDLGTFLRECTIALVRDYGAKPDSE